MSRRLKPFLVLAVALAAGACASAKTSGGAPSGPAARPAARVATDATYGYTEEKPIRVGGGIENGAASERAYLRTLRGPNGEPVTFVRKASCCRFDYKQGPMGVGFLDIYEVTYAGLSKPVTLYLDMYHPAEALIPVGFKAGPDLQAQPADTRRT